VPAGREGGTTTTALKRARLANGMSKRQAAEYLGYDLNRNGLAHYGMLEKHQTCLLTMILTMKLWNKCYHDRYRYGGTYAKPW
jgi:hypothetical protein